jgi:general stress protein CsbA
MQNWVLFKDMLASLQTLHLQPLEQKLFFATRAGLFLLLLTPLLFSHHLTHPFSSTQSYTILAVSEVVFLSYVWLASLFPLWRPRWTLVDKVFFIYVGILFITLLTGEDPFSSFWSSMVRTTGGLMWLHLSAVFIAVRGVTRTRENWVKLFTVSVSAALLSSFFHALSLVGIDLISLAAGGSTFGNSTYFATYLLFNFFFRVFYCDADNNTIDTTVRIWLCHSSWCDTVDYSGERGQGFSIGRFVVPCYLVARFFGAKEMDADCRACELGYAGRSFFRSCSFGFSSRLCSRYTC